MVIDDGRWIKERGTFSSFWELLDKHNDEEMNLFYGAYCDDRLRYTLCDGITLKQYTTWFKFESTEPQVYKPKLYFSAKSPRQDLGNLDTRRY